MTINWGAVGTLFLMGGAVLFVLALAIFYGYAPSSWGYTFSPAGIATLGALLIVVGICTVKWIAPHY